MTGLGWLMAANGNVLDFFPNHTVESNCHYVGLVLKMGFLESLWDHKAFSCGLIVLFFLLVTNQYQKALAPQMYVMHYDQLNCCCCVDVSLDCLAVLWLDVEVY